MTDYIDIVFDGPPGPEAGRFVEVENSKGASINFGEWVCRDDGYWVLRIAALEAMQTENEQSRHVIAVLHHDLLDAEQRVEELESILNLQKKYLDNKDSVIKGMVKRIAELEAQVKASKQDAQMQVEKLDELHRVTSRHSFNKQVELQKRIAELEANAETIDGWDLPSAMNRMDELESRVAELESALREIASYKARGWFKEVARKALKGDSHAWVHPKAWNQAQERIAELEGDLEVMRLQRNAKRWTRENHDN